jgi:hypothetical protein
VTVLPQLLDQLRPDEPGSADDDDLHLMPFRLCGVGEGEETVRFREGLGPGVRSEQGAIGARLDLKGEVAVFHAVVNSRMLMRLP